MKKDLNYYLSLKYDIHISPIPEAEGGGYETSIPLLGKYTFIGDGFTIEEALADLEQTKEKNFKSLLKERIAIPEPRNKQEEYSGRILLRVPRYLHKALAEQAANNGISLNLHLSSLLATGFPIEAMKKTLKELCDLWSSAIYQYEFHEDLHEPPTLSRGSYVSHMAA